MSMLPKLELTYVTETGYKANISTMGDTTHIMVNHFCYHIKQMPKGELRDVCQALLDEAKAKADEPRRGLVNMDGTIEYFTGEY